MLQDAIKNSCLTLRLNPTTNFAKEFQWTQAKRLLATNSLLSPTMARKYWRPTWWTPSSLQSSQRLQRSAKTPASNGPKTKVIPKISAASQFPTKDTETLVISQLITQSTRWMLPRHPWHLQSILTLTRKFSEWTRSSSVAQKLQLQLEEKMILQWLDIFLCSDCWPPHF